MKLDYHLIGARIARRRKQLKLTQAVVAERADINDQYLSNIERAVSIPSTEVIMRLAIALETTPDELLDCTARHEDERWITVVERLRGRDDKHLDMAESFLTWLSEQKL